jgi:gamma-glutamylcyclotransferase (GGCT)/AIG2-like uncharacterized protein YtfP
VVYAVCPKDLIRLDGFEGLPKSYSRELIQVKDEAGGEHKAWAYLAVADDPTRDYLPHNSYLALILTGARHFRLPPEYIKYLESLPATE